MFACVRIQPSSSCISTFKNPKAKTPSTTGGVFAFSKASQEPTEVNLSTPQMYMKHQIRLEYLMSSLRPKFVASALEWLMSL
jgi:hypothetical protein